MIVEGISLLLGGVFGFIIGIALIEEHCNNIVNEYREENIRFGYELDMVKKDYNKAEYILRYIDDMSKDKIMEIINKEKD